MVKSGTDFRNYSIVTLTFQENGRVDVKIEKQTISAAIPENEDMKKIVSEFAGYLILYLYFIYCIPGIHFSVLQDQGIAALHSRAACTYPFFNKMLENLQFSPHHYLVYSLSGQKITVQNTYIYIYLLL